MTDPQQERSWRSRARVLEATRTLLVEQGPEAVVLADVARLAGVGVGTIYTRFSDKTALLREVHREEAGAIKERSLAALAGVDDPSGAGAVDRAVRAVADVFLEHATVMRQIFLLAGADRTFRDQGDALSHPVADAFCALLVDAGAARGPGAAERAGMGYEIVFAACTHRITFGGAGPLGRELTDAEFVTHLVAVVAGYLAG